MSSRQPSRWALPDNPPSSCSLSDVTLTDFYEAFCRKNELSTHIEDQHLQPWDVILQAYKRYVQKNYGTGTLQHISEALSKTKLRVPRDLIEEHIRQLLVEDLQTKKPSDGILSSRGHRKRALDIEDSEMSRPATKQLKGEVRQEYLILWIDVLL